MKIDRKAFKSIVKECLLELLAEGLASNDDDVVKESRSSQPIERLFSGETKTRKASPKPRVNSAMIDAARAAAGSDPIMESILADTARTTYAKNAAFLTTAETAMDSSSRANMGAALDPVGQAVANSSPEEMFGTDTMAQWAALAFPTPAGPGSGRS